MFLFRFSLPKTYSDSVLLLQPETTSRNHLLVYLPYQLSDMFFQKLAPDACAMGTERRETK